MEGTRCELCNSHVQHLPRTLMGVWDSEYSAKSVEWRCTREEDNLDTSVLLLVTTDCRFSLQNPKNGVSFNTQHHSAWDVYTRLHPHAESVGHLGGGPAV